MDATPSTPVAKQSVTLLVRAASNLCSLCGLDFTTTRGFDRHRVGRHAYTYAEGLAMTPMREDGRRCLDASELQELGMNRDKRGRWRLPASKTNPNPWGRVA